MTGEKQDIFKKSKLNLVKFGVWGISHEFPKRFGDTKLNVLELELRRWYLDKGLSNPTIEFR